MSGFKKSLLSCAISIATMFNANANTDGPFLNEAHLNGKVRTVYYNIENAYGKTQGEKIYRSGAWTGGLQVNLQSGYLGDTFAMGGSAYGVVKLSMDEDEFSHSYQLLDKDNKGFAKLGQLWADLKFSNNISNDNGQLSGDSFSGNVKIGRQLLYNGLISSSGSRSVPSTWQGVNFNGTMDSLNLGLAWVDKMSLRDEDDFNKLVDFNNNHIDYIIGGEIIYTVNLPDESELLLKYRNAFSKDFLQAHNGDLSWQKPLGNELQLQLGVKYYHTKKDGDLWQGEAWYKPAFDDNAMALNLNGSLSFREWRFYGVVGTFRAQSSLKEYKNGFARPGVYYYDFGKNTHGIWDLATSGFAEDMMYDDETVWVLGVDYDFSTLGASGLKMGYSYHYGSGIEVLEESTGKSKSVSENEHDVYIVYAFPESLKGLEFKLEYGRYRNDKALRQAISKEDNDLRVWLDYDFSIF